MVMDQEVTRLKTALDRLGDRVRHAVHAQYTFDDEEQLERTQLEVENENLRQMLYIAQDIHADDIHAALVAASIKNHQLVSSSTAPEAIDPGATSTAVTNEQHRGDVMG